ncbi:hypothetical protein [Lentzea flava]|uniref:Uncharacterized protein n=1 Tax=Lentzea flava TaxID=103732 RepID=A0ABQ2UH75_9PSEU|nr:hypothetical protein [Lentzea flava]MCP2198554.1 hypothetical protein [Lentzea flava]GGU26674.1 hypothetical protein GCM10010178_18840 [Lentzea flava]
MWSELAKDVGGVLLFVVWLAVPPLYVIVLGRTYLVRCRLLYQELRDHGCECDCCVVGVGRHALDRRK